jgi:hypothetical protein
MAQRTDVVGVFETEAEARRAAEAAKRAGVDPSVIRIGDRRDRVRELEGEMLDEMEHTVMGPGNVGPFTREMTRAMVPLTIVVGVVGALVALPFAAIEFGDLPLWGRLIIVAVCGGATGSLVGFQLGGMYGARRPEEPLAVERGVTLAIDDAPESAVDVLKAMHPIQLDAFDKEGKPLGAILAEDDVDHHGGLKEDLETHMRNRDLEGG